MRLKPAGSLEGCPAGAGGVQPGFAGRLGAGLTVRLKQAGSLEGCPAGAGGVQPGFAGRLGAGFTVRLKQPGSLEGCPAGAGGVQPGFAGRLLAVLTVRLKQADRLEGCPAGAGGVQPGFAGRLLAGFDGETEAAWQSRRMSRRRRWCSARLCRPPPCCFDGETSRLCKQADSLEGCPAGAGGVPPGFAGRLLAVLTVRLKQPGSLEGCPAGAGGVPSGFAGRLLAGSLTVRLKQQLTDSKDVPQAQVVFRPALQAASVLV